MKYTEYETINGRKFWTLDPGANKFDVIREIAKVKKISMNQIAAVQIWLKAKKDGSVDVYLKRVPASKSAVAIVKKSLLEEWGA